MEHHEPSGMYYNWYDEATGERDPQLARHRGQGVPVRLQRRQRLARRRALGGPQRRARGGRPGAPAVRPDALGRLLQPGRLATRAGSCTAGSSPCEGHDRPGGVYLGTHIGGEDVWLTTHHYDTIVSETRITSYLGIMTGQVPAEHYFAAWRTFPATCDWDWHEMQPVGVTRNYLGLDVYEGAYTYRGMHIVPGWGGSMFEELMPNVFVPEEDWGPRSWGVNHPLHVRAQIEHGMVEADYGYWGFSPSSDPFANYREYGVDALGLNPEGYFSDHEKTNYDAGFGECRAATNPNPDYGDGVVTPHAPFLAMMHAPAAAYANLSRLEQNLGAYGPGGFYDAVAVGSGTVAKRYLSLDQAMVMGAIGNVAAGTSCAGPSAPARSSRRSGRSSRWRSSARARPDAAPSRLETDRRGRGRRAAPVTRPGDLPALRGFVTVAAQPPQPAVAPTRNQSRSGPGVVGVQRLERRRWCRRGGRTAGCRRPGARAPR